MIEIVAIKGAARRLMMCIIGFADVSILSFFISLNEISCALRQKKVVKNTLNEQQ